MRFSKNLGFIMPRPVCKVSVFFLAGCLLHSGIAQADWPPKKRRSSTRPRFRNDRGCSPIRLCFRLFCFECIRLFISRNFRIWFFKPNHWPGADWAGCSSQCWSCDRARCRRPARDCFLNRLFSTGYFFISCCRTVPPQRRTRSDRHDSTRSLGDCHFE